MMINYESVECMLEYLSWDMNYAVVLYNRGMACKRESQQDNCSRENERKLLSKAVKCFNCSFKVIMREFEYVLDELEEEALYHTKEALESYIRITSLAMLITHQLRIFDVDGGESFYRRRFSYLWGFLVSLNKRYMEHPMTMPKHAGAA